MSSVSNDLETHWREVAVLENELANGLAKVIRLGILFEHIKAHCRHGEFGRELERRGYLARTVNNYRRAAREFLDLLNYETSILWSWLREDVSNNFAVDEIASVLERAKIKTQVCLSRAHRNIQPLGGSRIRALPAAQTASVMRRLVALDDRLGTIDIDSLRQIAPALVAIAERVRSKLEQFDSDQPQAESVEKWAA